MKNRQKNGRGYPWRNEDEKKRPFHFRAQATLRSQKLIVKLSAKMAGCLLHIVNTIPGVVTPRLILSEEKLG